MVRRLKGELRKHVGSQIPERRTIRDRPDDLPEGTPELVLASMLAEYTDILERRLAGSSNRTKAAGKLVTIALQKRLLSSVEAFARTLAVHRRNAGKIAPIPTTQAPASPQVGFLDEAGETDDDLTDEQAAELDEVGVARATKAGASAGDDARAKTLLDEMTAIADGARDLPDAKVRAIVDWIRDNQCPGLPKAGDKRAGAIKWSPPVLLPAEREEDRVLFKGALLIFTEYAHTKDYLLHQLEAALAGTDLAGERILALHGGMPEEDREQVKQAFNDAKHPVRILDRDRCGAGGRQSPGAVCRPLPLRSAVESGPHGAAERSHRPDAASRRTSSGVTTSSTRTGPRIAFSRRSSRRPR